MARIELAATPFGVVVDNAFRPVAGATVNVFTAGTTTPIVVYADATTSTPVAQPLITDVDGRLVGWADPFQTVDIVAALEGITYPTLQGELVRGDAVAQLDSATGSLTLAQLPAHAATHGRTGSDPITPTSIGAATIAEASAALQIANDLSDLHSAATARTHLGLGSVATLAAAQVAQTANNLSDLASADTARANLQIATLASAQVAATGNLSALSGLQTVDGYTLAAGDRLLLTAQTSGVDNGPWVAQSGSWTRPGDYPTGATFQARLIQVNGGTQAGLWAASSTTPVTVGTSATSWSKTSGGTTAGVSSFASRTGAVTPQHGDISYAVRTTHTYSLQGPLQVASGSTDANYLPPFFVSVGANETVRLVKARAVIGGGTSVACTLQRNGTNITGFTSLTVTPTPASVTPTAVSLAEDDEINLVLSSLAGAPTNLTFTIVLEHTVT